MSEVEQGVSSSARSWDGWLIVQLRLLTEGGWSYTRILLIVGVSYLAKIND